MLDARARAPERLHSLRDLPDGAAILVRVLACGARVLSRPIRTAGLYPNATVLVPAGSIMGTVPGGKSVVDKPVHGGSLRVDVAAEGGGGQVVRQGAENTKSRGVMSDVDLSVEQVNAELEAKGFDPEEIRAFAWELVEQDLRAPLHHHYGPRMQEVKVRLWRIVESLMGAGASIGDLSTAISELAGEIAKR